MKKMNTAQALRICARTAPCPRACPMFTVGDDGAECARRLMELAADEIDAKQAERNTLQDDTKAEMPMLRPEIVCLCGSTRFYDAFQRANYELTMQGVIVLSVGFFPHSQAQAHGQIIGCTPEQKAALDELHKRKIDLCDRVLVLNVGGYIGDSTRSEIAYAMAIRKPVNYLEDVRRCRVCGCTDNNACPGGCYWVGPDLCSVCAEKPAIQPKEDGDVYK